MTTETVPFNLELWLRLYQRLTEQNHKPTSPSDRAYNCFAWAAGVCDERWDHQPPDGYGKMVWPEDLPRDYAPSTFIALFERVGFEECGNGDPEDGFQKIALFVADNEVQQAARLLESGEWASKIGFEQLDISHVTVDALAGESYGLPEIFMRRRRIGRDPEAPSVALLPPNPLSARTHR